MKGLDWSKVGRKASGRMVPRKEILEWAGGRARKLPGLSFRRKKKGTCVERSLNTQGEGI